MLALSFALILPLYAVGLALDWSPNLLAWLTPLMVVVAGILHDRLFSTGHFWTR